MALTLIESAKVAMGKNEMVKGTIMELYAKESDILQWLPFETITGNALTFNREKELPGVAFRGVNEGYTESTGKTDKITESLAIAGGDLDVDKFLVDTSGMEQRSVQEQLKIKALSLSLTKTLVKGSIETDAKEFDGLQVRALGDQLIAAGSASGGDVLSLAKLDELIDAVEDPNALYMNKTMRRRLTQAARNTSVGGYITYSQDAFGRRVTQYNDLPILIADKDNTNTDILGFTESQPGGGTAASTSIYCLSMDDTGVMGLQGSAMQVRDMGEIDSKPVFRTRIEWYITMALMRQRAIGRIWGIKDGAVAV